MEVQGSGSSSKDEKTSDVKKEVKKRKKVYKKALVIPRQKSLGDNLLSYKIPLNIYEKYVKEINSDDNSWRQTVRKRCHKTTYDGFNTSEAPNNAPSLLVAAKQAFEDRDFKTLIEILAKSLKINDAEITQQVQAYMEIAGFQVPDFYYDNGRPEDGSSWMNYTSDL